MNAIVIEVRSPGPQGPEALVPAGDWAPGHYAPRSLVRHADAHWLARIGTEQEPSGGASDWELWFDYGDVFTQGVDARLATDAAPDTDSTKLSTPADVVRRSTQAIFIRRGSVLPTDTGAVGNGIADDTAALNAAFAKALSQGNSFKFLSGGVHKVAPNFAIPSGLKIEGRGAILRSDGTASGAQKFLTLGDDIDVEELVLSILGSETTSELMTIGDRLNAGLISVIADAQKSGDGIATRGQDVRIDTVLARKIDRPWHFKNVSTTPTTGSRIGHLDVEDYVRGFAADNCSHRLESMYSRGRSANASMTPGHNAVIIQGCRDFWHGSLVLDDAGEHAYRIGGSPAGTWTSDFNISSIRTNKPNGCPLKIAPSTLASPGVTEKVKRGYIGSVVGVDVGYPSIAGNKELLRLTHVEDITIGSAEAVCKDASASSQSGLRINDAKKVRIGSLGGKVSADFVLIDGTSDVDGVNQFGGDVTDLVIDRIWGECSGNTAINVSTTFSVGNIHLGLDLISGQAVNVGRWNSGTLVAPFVVTGQVGGNVVPAFQDIPAGNLFSIRLAYKGHSAVGKSAARYWSAQEINGDAVDVGGAPAQGTLGTLTLGAPAAPQAAGANGAALSFNRNGSSRRGASIVSYQSTADNKETGLRIYVGDSSSTANESLPLALQINHLGRVNFSSGLATFADNAAALLGGLVVGDVYWTAAGELRRVV